MAAKKKRAKRATAEQRAIGSARVEALVKAGETQQKACEKVGKELGAAPLTVKQWVQMARKSNGGPPSRAPKRATNGAGSAVASLAQTEVLAEQLIGSLAAVVRTIVREEIRRMLS